MTVVSDYTALLSGSSINGTTGKGVFVSFSFPTIVPEYLYRSYSAAGLATFQPYSAAGQAAARAAIAAWSAVSGITFYEVAPGDGDIKFMDFNLSALNSNAAGFAFFPDNGYPGSINSDIFIGHQYIADAHILLHEIGHALGLKHPFEGSVTLDTSVDNFAHTVMSYTSGGSQGNVLGNLDIDAIRAIYGNEGNKGTQSTDWSWNASTLTLTQNGTAGNDTLFGIGGNDVINGGDGDDKIVGKDGVNYLSGGAGKDNLIGGNGYNHLSGGDGNDTLEIYADGFTLQFDVDGGTGTDSLSIVAFGFRGTTFSFPDAIAAGSKLTNIESTVISLGDGTLAYTAVGSAFNDTFYLSGGNDTVYGGDGDDYIVGGAGNDVMYGGAGNDTIDGVDGNDTGYGGAGNDQFRGTLGRTEYFDGGAGTDTYTVTAASMTTGITLALDQLASLGVTLVNVESVGITGTTAADTLTEGDTYTRVSLNGYDGNDIIIGGSGGGISALGSLFGGNGDDAIYAGTGAHFMYGGAGTDRFVYLSSAGSTADLQDQLEDFQTGTDKVDLSGLSLWNLKLSSTTGNGYITGDGLDGPFQLFVRAAIVLGDILASTTQTAPITGTSGADTRTGAGGSDYLFGDAGNDTLSGLAGNDLIDGGQGTDKMYGGLGDDSYYVDRQDDLVFENAGEGVDTVFATTSFYLYANIENLKLTGYSNYFGVGNDLDNRITGNSNNNTLLAGAGADIVHGGNGVDIIYGEAGNDQLFGDEGNDTIIAGIGDDMLDGGYGGDSLYGEDGNDTLWGGADFVFDQLVGGNGNDILHGDSGQGDYDYLYGNLGDDIFYVDTPADLVFEQSGEGTDIVYAAIDGGGYYLYDNIENLTLLANTPFGVGNALANTLTGNAIGNYLLGGGGNDTLNGKAGNDVLFGEAGTDTFVFEHGTGGDVIGDFVPGTDRIDLRAIGYTSFAQLQSHMVENGGTTAIDLGGGDIVVINGVTMAQLHAGDFILTGSASIPEPLAAQTEAVDQPEASMTLDSGLHLSWTPMKAAPWMDLAY